MTLMGVWLFFFSQNNYQEQGGHHGHKQGGHKNFNGNAGIAQGSPGHHQVAGSEQHQQPGRKGSNKRERERPVNRGNDDPSSG